MEHPSASRHEQFPELRNDSLQVPTARRIPAQCLTLTPRKRSVQDFEQSAKYEWGIQTPLHPPKRSRENSYDSDDGKYSTSATTCLAPWADTPSPNHARSTPSPLSDCESILAMGSLRSPLGLPYSYSTNTLSTPTMTETPPYQPDGSSSNSSPTTEPEGNGSLRRIDLSRQDSSDNGSFPQMEDADGDLCMDDANPEELAEMCFGMIQDSRVMTSRNQKMGAMTPLSLRYHKELRAIAVHLESGEYWGLLDRCTTVGLMLLLELESIRLQVFTLVHKSVRKVAQGLQDPLSGIPIYINVYGFENIFEDVGKILSDNQIFLQHPQHNESHLEYKNPHFLTIPNGVISTPSTPSRIPSETMDKITALFETIEHKELPRMDPAPIIRTPLLCHQKEALSFMVEREDQQALNNIKKPISATSPDFLRCALGGILADQMGLGKSLTTLALITSTLNQAEAFRLSDNPTQAKPLLHVKTTLLIAPKSILSSWQEQIDMHVEAGILNVYLYHGPRRELDPRELAKFDIIMTTYQTVASEVFPKARAKNRESPLKDIMWFRVVLDEAHIIRERSTQQSRAVCSLEAKNRWCLTGTPIQNKLDDLGSLIKFLRVKPYDDVTSFNRLIVNPLKMADPRGLQQLRLLIRLFSIRRTRKILTLPPRKDQIEYVQFSTTEKQVYEACTKDSTTLIDAALSGKVKGSSYFGILQSFLRLRLICDHGKELLPREVNDRIEGYIQSQQYMGSVSVNTYTQTQDLFGDTNLAICEFCNCPITKGNSRVEISALCLHVVCSKCLLRQTPSESQGNEGTLQLLCPICEETNDTQNAQDQVDSKVKAKWMDGLKYNGPSTKVKALLGKLRDSEPLKSVVFSYWTKMLDLIEIALGRENMRFARVDGSMTLQQREVALASFRTDPLVNILLISIGSGSVGLNLTVASRVHLLEPQWNPMVEQQALDRVHRIGQTREVITTRYIMKDSFEESVLAFQQRKLALVDLSLAQGSTTKTEELRDRLKELRGLFK